MRVRDQDPQEVLPPFDDVGEVRIHQVDSRRVLLPREAHAAIDQDPFAPLLRPEAVERGIHADLAETSERDEDELVTGTGHGQS